MIARIWHGWTLPNNAEAYEHLLRGQIFPWITGRNIAGLRSIELLRRADGNLVEFVTLMVFDSMAAVVDFAGPDYETAVVKPEARALLERFDARSQHYDIIDKRGS